MDEIEDQPPYGEGSFSEDRLPHQVDNNQTSHIQAQFATLCITEANEVIVTEEGHPYSPPANHHASIEDSTSPIHPANTTYVIRTPAALTNFFTTQPPAFIKTIRLTILYPLESVLLTEEEQMGGSGPNITPVFTAWMDAFKSIPPTIQLIQVDISHSFPWRTLMLGRLAQHLSTTVYLRSERRTRFEVVGATTGYGKAFIEGSMVGLREGSADWREARRLRVGAE